MSIRFAWAVVATVGLGFLPQVFGAGVYYVDANAGNDSYDGTAAVWAGGTSTVGPRKSLVAIMKVAKNDGDIVYAAEGTYASEVINVKAGGGTQNGNYRVSIPAGVSLIASGRQDMTIIEGQPATGVSLDESPYGCGSDAVRGVYLNGKSVVKGFTIRKCYAAPSWASSYYGGGVVGGGYVIDCHLTGNVAPRGAGSCEPTAIRCRYDGNRGNWTGTDMQGGNAFNCLFGDCTGGANVSAGLYYNCTFTGSSSLDNAPKGFFNCLMTKKCNTPGVMTNCLTTVTLTGMGEGSEVVTAAQLLLIDSRPRRTSVAVNRSADGYYDDAFPSADLPDEKDLDLDRNARKVGSALDVGAYECQNLEPCHYYVNAEKGDDAADGKTPETARQSLAAICSLADLLAGDTIHAAPGVYSNKTQTVSGATYRCVIPEGVKLVADGSRDETVIEGAPAEGVSLTESPWGCGTGAIRGVCLGTKAQVRGFTIRKCYGPAFTSSTYGAATVGDGGYVIDCHLTGNVSGRGAALSSTTAVRCLFDGNRGGWTGADSQGGNAFNCVFGAYSGVYNVSGGTYCNCTFYDEGSADYNETGCYNCLVLKKSSSPAQLIQSICTGTSSGLGPGSKFVRPADVFVRDGFVPYRGSPAVNGGSNELYAAAFPSADLPDEAGKDFYGRARTVGTIDVGAIENQAVGPCDYYVDAENGDDANDGETAATAFQSLAAVCSVPGLLLAGDTIHAAPGVYSNKTQTVSGATYRCVIPDGVKLVADGSRDETVIEGAPADGVSLVESPWGCGAGAIRGVCLGEKAQVRGFTIRKCYGPAFTSSTYGAATVGYGYVIDCHLTGNVSGRGAALSSTTAVRCLFDGNRGGWTGADSQGGNAFNCVFGAYSGSQNASGGTYCNCTFYDGGTATYEGSYLNCLLLKGSGKPENLTRSLCTTSYGGFGPDSRYVRSTEIKVWNGFVPYRSSPAVNGGSNELYAAAFPSADLPDEADKDFFGRPRLVGAVDVGAVECTGSEIPFAFYVNATTGADANDGLTPETAKRTLAAAVTDPDLISGDTVHAAAGFYDVGAVTNQGAYRVVVPEGVTVVADAGRAETFIVGAEDSTSEHPLKYGPNAVRCAYLNANSLLVGFCLTNGVVSSNDGQGGGACGVSSGALVDCEIVGCKAYRGGALTSVRAIGCSFHDNVTDYTGSDIYSGGGCYSCIFGRRWMYVNGALSDTSSYSVYSGSCDFINCTFYGFGSFTAGNVGDGLYFRNCIFDCEGMGGVHIRNSVRTSQWGVTDDVADSFVTNVAALALDADKRPCSGSAAIDRGRNEYLDLVPAALRAFASADAGRSQRVYNGAVDLGAFEYDWRGDFARSLGHSSVSAATTNVVLSASGLVVNGAQSLEGTLKVRAERSYSLKPTISGTGALTVTAGGEILVPENGVYTVKGGAVDGTVDFSMSFDGEGAATLGRFRSNAGQFLLVR